MSSNPPPPYSAQASPPEASIHNSANPSTLISPLGIALQPAEQLVFVETVFWLNDGYITPTLCIFHSQIGDYCQVYNDAKYKQSRDNMLDVVPITLAPKISYASLANQLAENSVTMIGTSIDSRPSTGI
jgi:hypothetical protein